MKIVLLDNLWDYNIETPYREPLGGTHSAICYFLEEMAKQGHECFLFNKKNTEEISRGVKCLPITYIGLIPQIQPDFIIISCDPILLSDVKHALNLNVPYILWTGHDFDQPINKPFYKERYVRMVDLFLFVSDWQTSRYIANFNVPKEKTLVMRYGISPSFEKYVNTNINELIKQKKKKSIVYSSVPWRGLNLYTDIYPLLKSQEPEASLEIYSGMNIYRQEKDEYENLYNDLGKMDGIKISKGIGQEELGNKISKIEFMGYPNTFPETGCISVLQAMACGCIIISSNLGVMSETTNNNNLLIPIDISYFNKDIYVNNFVECLKYAFNMNENKKREIIEKNIDFIKKNHIWKNICADFATKISSFSQIYKKFIENDYQKQLTDATELFKLNNYLESLKKYIQIQYFTNLNILYTYYLNIGVCFSSLGDKNSAIKAFKNAKTISKNFNIYKNLGLIHEDINNKKMEKYLRKSLQYEYNTIIATKLGNYYESNKNYENALSIYKSVLQVDPTSISVLNNYGSLLKFFNCSYEKESPVLENYIKAFELIKNIDIEERRIIYSNLLLGMLYSEHVNDLDIYNFSCKWENIFLKNENLTKIRNKYDLTKKNDKIRVGYISTDFNCHPVGYMFESILKNHNTSKFEIFCYDNSTNYKDDILSNKLRNYNNATWVQIKDMTDEELLEKICSDNIDVIIDAMGHTRGNRMNIFQYKPAKVIASWFAYPSTSGIKEIDYKITDIYANPYSTEKYYTEKLFRMPNGFQCYTPIIDFPIEKNYNRDYINLCCFNNPHKFSKSFIKMVSIIMHKLPTARLTFSYLFYSSPYIREFLWKQFENLGIPRDRITITNHDVVGYMKLYNFMDIALDPFPYNGGNISSESLYMNTPLITLEGTNYVSRLGVSLLSNIGLEKYIAKTTDEYIHKVIELANNKEELHELHKTIRNKMLQTDLANSKLFAKHFEEGIIEMLHSVSRT